MQTRLLWSGIEYYSLENCLVKTGKAGNKISSTIVGLYSKKIYTVEYYLETDKQWQTFFLRLKYSINNKIKNITLRKTDKHWLLNNRKKVAFDNCFDVDISITPFTNILPIKRLQLKENREHIVNVIYIDIFDNTIKALQQSYQRISRSIYFYKNVPNDFEVKIEVDRSGFVVNYPSLFKRTAIIEENK